MSDLKVCVFALCATAFALTFIVLVSIYGGHLSRSAAILACLAGVMSQYVVQDIRAQRLSLVFSYLGFIASILAMNLFVIGY